MNSKRCILIDATGGSKWIGGLYYKKNVLYALSLNKSLLSQYRIVVVTEKENMMLFKAFIDVAKIVTICYKSETEKKFKLLIIAKLFGSKIIFPYWGKKIFSKFGIKEIYWIADFQECYYPHFFSEQLISDRANVSSRVVNEKLPLILSSETAYNDLKKFFGGSSAVYVMPFVSYIEDELSEITEHLEIEVVEKYDLEKQNYFCICNQFWQHKNHVIVLKAIKKICKNDFANNMVFVFTGELKDYRNPSYYQELKELFDDEDVKKHVKLLGFIDRKEQLVLIKNAKAIIQPSFFEGWGTVLEDAKVFDQTVVLSNIPVHQEQKNDKCIFFEPDNVDDLAERILQVEFMQDKKQDYDAALVRTNEYAYRYSCDFMRMLEAEW